MDEAERTRLAARWRALVEGPDAAVPLDEAALVIAAHADPGLDPAAVLGRLDGLAAQVASPDVDSVVEVVFGRLGLRGDTVDYDDPANSYLDRVLQRRLGIPISLAVVLIEVARRRGVRLEGVGMPGHFLVRDPSRPEELLDPFDAGRRLDREACVRLLRRVAGAGAELSPTLVAPAGPRAVLARMLANLDRSFRRRGDVAGLTWVSSLAVALPDAAPRRVVELAGLLADLGRLGEAADALERLAARPELPETTANELGRRALGVRARLN